VVLTFRTVSQNNQSWELQNQDRTAIALMHELESNPAFPLRGEIADPPVQLRPSSLAAASKEEMIR